MEESGFGFDEFSVEMGDFEIKKVKKYDRMWRVEHGGSIASPPVFYKNAIYFGSADHFVYAINPSNGKLLWKYKTEGSIVVGSVIVHDGVLYVGSFDHNMYAIQADTGKMTWKFRTNGRIGSTPVFDGGILFFGGEDQNVYALDAKSGELVWKFRTFDCIMSEPVIVGNKLFIGSDDHFLYCLDKKTGRLIWRFETQGEIHNTNAFPVRDGIIYFGSFDNYLRAVDIDTGKLSWKTKIGNYGITASPVIFNEMILQQSRDGILFALNLAGKKIWKFVTKDVIGIPCVHEDNIYIGSSDYCMYCLDFAGRELWHFKTNGYVYWKSLLIGSRLYFGSWDCFLYCIDTGTRQVIWRFKTSGSPSPIPPAYEAFELQLKIPKISREEGRKKSYEINITGESEGIGSFYKSRITYQVSTQYREKGKYQIDTDEEAF